MENKVSKWQQWYDSLDTNTKTYLSTQAIWRDSDLFKFATISFVVGFILGWAL